MFMAVVLVCANTRLACSGFQDGIATNAYFTGPNGVAVSPDGTKLFVADYVGYLLYEAALRVSY